MTKNEALKMAVKALDLYDYTGTQKESELYTKALQACKDALEQPLTRDWKETIDERIAKDDAFKQALEQPAQEPVAWMLEYKEDEFDYWHKNCDEDKLALEMWFDAIRCDTTEHKIYPLYTHPAPSWQGLSDDEISHLKYLHVDYELFDEGEYGTECNVYVDEFARAIEQALKEKNNGSRT